MPSFHDGIIRSCAAFLCLLDRVVRFFNLNLDEISKRVLPAWAEV